MASGITASNLTWNWSIADTTNTSVQGLVNITDSSNPNNVFDNSNNTFEVRGALNLTQPDAGGILLTYDRGVTNYNVVWAKAGGISNVNISYATDGVNFVNPIVNNLSATASPYAWPVPDAIGTNLKVRVKDSQNNAVNDSIHQRLLHKGEYAGDPA